MKNENAENNFKIFLRRAAKVLLPVAAALCYGVFGVTFIYAAVLAAAWKSALAFFLAAAIAFIAAGLAVFATVAACRLIGGTPEQQPEKDGVALSRAQAAQRFLLKNGGYIPLLIAVICVVAVAALGGIDSEKWVEERAAYCASVGYLAETETRTTAFQREYYVLDDENTEEDESRTVVITAIEIDAEGRTAVIRYADTEGDLITVETRILYENEYTIAVRDGNTLTVTHNAAPPLESVTDKMLAPMFKPSSYEKQFVVTVPPAYRDCIEIKVTDGEVIYAKD